MWVYVCAFSCMWDWLIFYLDVATVHYIPVQFVCIVCVILCTSNCPFQCVGLCACTFVSEAAQTPILIKFNDIFREQSDMNWRNPNSPPPQARRHNSTGKIWDSLWSHSTLYAYLYLHSLNTYRTDTSLYASVHLNFCQTIACWRLLIYFMVWCFLIAVLLCNIHSLQ